MYIFRRGFIFFILWFVLPGLAYSQKNISQLVASLQSAHDTDKAEIYYNIYTYYKFYQPDSAYYFLNDGVKKFTANGNTAGIASLTQLLGVLDASHGNLVMARKRELEALDLFTKLKRMRGVGLAYNTLGTIEGRKGNWDSAGAYFIKAQKIFQEIQYNDGLSNTYTNLGLLYQNSGKMDKALLYYNKLLEIAMKDTTNTRAICDAYNNIAITYGQNGNLDSAVNYLQRALRKADKEQYIDVYMYSLLNMGIVYSKFNINEKALSYLNDALSIAKEKQMPDEYANILLNIAPITANKNPKAAIIQLEEALKVAKSVGNKSIIRDVYELLAELNKRIGNYKEVVTLMELTRKYDDSIASVEKTREIANLQSVYELGQSNERIKELQLAEQVNTSRRNVLLAILGGVLIAVIFILLYVYRIRKLNVTLARQEAQLKTSNAVKDRLFSIIGHDLRGPVGNITMILDMLSDEDTTAEERLQIIQSLGGQSRSTLVTLDNLLAWGRSQITATGSKPELFLPQEYVQKNLELLKVGAKYKKLAIINDTNTEIRLYGDPLHFDFVIRNLLANAIKFTQANGSISITTDTDKIPGYVVYAVKDTGIGMTQEIQDNVFTPFTTQARGTAGEKGTGIGLTLSKEFVTAAGGDIWIESEIGKGTTFYFSFKAA